MNQIQNNILNSAVSIIKKINQKVIDGGLISGQITLTKECIYDIKILFDRNLIEIYTSEYTSIDVEELDNHLYIDLKIELKVGDITNYYFSLNDFVSGNRYECKHTDYFIEEINYRRSIDGNSLIDQYYKNLLIIDFLQSIAENTKKVGHQLEFFFYKSGKGADLKI